jgi:gliding motility-associated-like protein
VSISGNNFLGAIENPDILGVGANYLNNAVSLGSGQATFGLPPFIQSFFNVGIDTQNVCLGTSAIFSISSNEPIDSILWDFGDGLTSNLENPTHDYMSAGVFNVTVNVVSGTNVVDLTRDIVVSEVPIANAITDYAICDDSSNNEEEIFNLSIKDSEIIGSQSSTQFAVSYFLNQDDADNNDNAIDINYSNISNSQTIFARIYNVDNSDCYATVPFNLIVSQFPIANTIADVIVCDDVSQDGVEFVNLGELNDAVLNGQAASDFNVSYHLTQTEANDGLGDLPNNFETLSNLQPIYIRVENALNNSCYNTSMFLVTVDDFFELNQPDDLFLCDDASNDTVEFFNIAAQSDSIIEGLDGNYNVTYHTSQENANNNIDSISGNYENISNPQEIFVRVEKTTNVFCFQTISFFIEVKETPILDMETTSYICTGETLILTATPGFDTYLWSTGEESNSITVESGGNYTVTVSNNYNTVPAITCSVTETITVIESNEAVFNTVEILDWSLNSNSIQVFIEGIGDYEYSTNGLDYQDSPVFTNLEAGEYNVYVRDKFGCGIIEQEVYLLFYPYYFTPNNDGVHDFWQIKFSETEPDLVIKIFDRYGKWLTNINPRGRGWDGTFKGKLLPASDYWFVVTRPSNNKEYTGHFALKR